MNTIEQMGHHIPADVLRSALIVSGYEKHEESTIVVRFIDDRQYLLQDMKARQLGLDAYMYDRLDMYWITLHYHGQKVTFCIDPCPSGHFVLLPQGSHNKITSEMEEIATKLFKKTPEYQQMIQWYEKLEDSGYFEDGAYPGKNTVDCPMCNQRFKIGSTHEHCRFDGRIVVHNGRQYKKITDAGLTVNWRPGFKLEYPSLEEQDR